MSMSTLKMSNSTLKIGLRVPPRLERGVALLIVSVALLILSVQEHFSHARPRLERGVAGGLDLGRDGGRERGELRLRRVLVVHE